MSTLPPGPELALLGLLVAGHALGDFVFQTRRMVEEKGRAPVLLGHAAAVALAHLLALVPYLSWTAAAASGALGLAHGAVDWAKTRLLGARRAGIAVFLADQAVHAATVVGVWLVLRGMDPDAWLWLPDDTTPTLYAAAVLVTGFAFVGNGGSGLVRGVLAHLGAGASDGGAAASSGSSDGTSEESAAGASGLDDSGLEGSGHLIGILERLLGLVLVLMGQWGALAIVMAAKSIARFEELKERRFAEYYLVGTLASLVVAVLTGLAVQLALP